MSRLVQWLSKSPGPVQRLSGETNPSWKNDPLFWRPTSLNNLFKQETKQDIHKAFGPARRGQRQIDEWESKARGHITGFSQVIFLEVKGLLEKLKVVGEVKTLF